MLSFLQKLLILISQFALFVFFAVCFGFFPSVMIKIIIKMTFIKNEQWMRLATRKELNKWRYNNYLLSV